MTKMTTNVQSQLHRLQLQAECTLVLTSHYRAAQLSSIVLVLLAATLLRDTQLIDSRFTFLLYFVSTSESNITTFATVPISVLALAYLLMLRGMDHGKRHSSNFIRLLPTSDLLEL